MWNTQNATLASLFQVRERDATKARIILSSKYTFKEVAQVNNGTTQKEIQNVLQLSVR